MTSDRDQTMSLQPDTTSEQELRTSGQRRINLIWETTHAMVAISVTLVTLAVCAYLVMSESSWTNVAFLLLSNVFFLVVGTYFSRTNHTKTGGISGPYDR